MEEKLVTLAIHTFEKAQILKTVLESEGIEAYIHNVNQIQPVISAGVRVRIKESELPHALRILGEAKWLNDDLEPEAEKPEKIVLIPVDFSDYSMKACEIGFYYALHTGARVMLLHAYYSSYVVPTSLPFGRYESASTEKDESIRTIYKRVQDDIENLCTAINRKIECGDIPEVEYSYMLREGLPEEEIISYAKEINPILIVMGTRGKKQKHLDLIGSVTGEVIEATKAPLLAIPESLLFSDIDAIDRFAFATSFNEADLLAFDKFVSLLNRRKLSIYLFNVSTSRNEWNEIRLTGFCEYLKKQYPHLDIRFKVLKDGDLLEAIDDFVKTEQIDVIAFSTYRRSMIMRIFNPSIARKMLFHGNTPLLLIPG